MPHVPIDVEGRLGLSNFSPGAADVQALEVIGPLGAFVNSGSNAIARAQAGDWQGVAQMGLPVGVRNALKGAT